MNTRPTRPRRLLVLALAIAWLASGAQPAAAQEDGPSNQTLVIVGAIGSVPVYFLGVTWHEGSHALVAKAYGAEITAFHILPGRHPRTGVFYFGYVDYRGRLEPGEKALFLIAPKLTDLLLLGTYSALVGFDVLPENRYGQLSLAMLGTAAWVDFSKDLFSTRDTNDTVRFYNQYGRTSEIQRLPFRALQLGISLGSAVALAVGYRRLFDRSAPGSTAFMLPLVDLRF